MTPPATPATPTPGRIRTRSGGLGIRKRARTDPRPHEEARRTCSRGTQGCQRNQGRHLRDNRAAASIRAVQIVAGQITVAELAVIAQATFGDLVKAVADVRRVL
jgi:hypothetical protein